MKKYRRLLLTLCFSSMLFFAVLLLQGKTSKAQRKKWVKQSIPSGMVLVPGGSCIIGQVDEDITSSKVNPNRLITVGSFYMDTTEITNLQYRRFIDALLKDPNHTLDEDFIMNNLYPDMKVWTQDIKHTMADHMLAYFSHPTFNDYPVVGITWEAAKYFAAWRTEVLNAERAEKKLPPLSDFSLPTAAQWEYAAKGGRILAKYPWGGPYVRDSKGVLRANFKSKPGVYREPGACFECTSPVYHYPPNDYGLYDMAGNVAEWCLDAHNPSASALVGDINPVYIDENQPLKVIKGGSWKDISYYLQTGVNSCQHKDSASSSTGFRCIVPAFG